jgi:nitrite reductase (NADH) large subunit
MTQNSKQNLVLVGNGMAGMRTVEEILKLEPEKYNITVFGDEPYGNYNRIMLSPVLANEKTLEEVMLNDDAWYKDNGITFEKGKKVTEIHRTKKEVTAEDGTVTPYDKLLIATGSTSFMLPLPGADKYGVIGFRDVKDVDAMV